MRLIFILWLGCVLFLTAAGLRFLKQTEAELHAHKSINCEVTK